VLIGGPNITLSPKTAVSLGMAVHELATNAAKHGALSTKAGSLVVTWHIAASENEVRISWIESGGPTVSQPQHSGFGRMLLERALASDLNGKVKLDFTKEGLNGLIAFPLDRQSAATVEDVVRDNYAYEHAVSASAARTLSAGGKSSNETRILIVEDESLLAMELEEFLHAAGYTIVGPFSDLGRATEAAHRETIDLAVLDSNLNGEMVYPLADELSAQGVPFIFVTGYGTSNLPERFRSAPRVPKPFDPAALINQLQRMGPKASTCRFP
jgi:chemotaxis family two-component system sensor kinase Cph1